MFAATAAWASRLVAAGARLASATVWAACSKCAGTDLVVSLSDGDELVFCCCLEVEEARVGAGQYQQGLIEVALQGGLLADLGVLQREEHHQGDGGGEGLERGQPRGVARGLSSAPAQNTMLTSAAAVLAAVLWETWPQLVQQPAADGPLPWGV